MNENDDRQSEGTPSPPSPPPGPWLPPRLRARLEEAELEPIKASPASTIIGWSVILVLIGAVVGGVMAIRHNEAMKVKAAAAKAEAERLVAVADSIRQVQTADSLKAVAVADSIKAFQALPRWKQEVILAKLHPNADSLDAPPTDEEGHFVIDGGEFLFEDAANQAADAAKARTKLTIRVTPVVDGDNTSYHLYVGNFTHKAEAAFTANQLLQKGALTEANVVKLPK